MPAAFLAAAALGGHFAEQLGIHDHLEDGGDAAVRGGFVGPEAGVARVGGADGGDGEFGDGAREQRVVVHGEELDGGVD